MKNFSVELSFDNNDVSNILSKVLSYFGSLGVNCNKWENLLHAMGAPINSQKNITLETAANEIIEEAVPEEGFPHPQRATWDGNQDNKTVWFTTPGGVTVTIYMVEINESIILSVDFNRDSVYLACKLLAQLSLYVDVYKLLAHAALDAAIQLD